MKNEETITFQELAHLLNINLSTLVSYFQLGKVSTEAVNIEEKTINKKWLLEYLKIKNCSEQFISSGKASAILNMPTRLNETICRQKGIPCRRFVIPTTIGKAPLLFLESEIRTWKDCNG